MIPHFLLCSRRNGVDLGVAIDGLSSSVPLFPAVSLYNRDDQLRLLPAMSRTFRRGYGGASVAARMRSHAQLRECLQHLGTPLSSAYVTTCTCAVGLTAVVNWFVFVVMCAGLRPRSHCRC